MRDDVITNAQINTKLDIWEHFPRNWPVVTGEFRSTKASDAEL